LFSSLSVIGFDFIIFTTIIGFDFSTFVRLIAFDFHKIKFILPSPQPAACGDLWKRKKRHEAYGFRWNP
jgi:hypothetical protein